MVDLTPAPVGGDIRVSSADGYSVEASLTGLADGGFVVTWFATGSTGLEAGVYGQLYDADGAARGGAFKISQQPVDRANTSVEALPDGGFTVAWIPLGSSTIQGRSYDAAGNPDPAGEVALWDLPADSVLPYQPLYVRLETWIDGTLEWNATSATLGSWDYTYLDASYVGVLIKTNYETWQESLEFTVDSATSRTRNPIDVGTDTSQGALSITALPDDGFVVSWAAFGPQGEFIGIHGRRYDSTGQSVGSVFEVPAPSSTGVTRSTTVSTIELLADGNLALAWSGGFWPSFGTDVSGLPATVHLVHVAYDRIVITSGGGRAVAYAAIDENSTDVIALHTAGPDNGTAPVWRIAGGDDAALFQISAHNELQFKAAPDFEVPADTGADNRYSVVVEVSDGKGGVDTQTIEVDVRDIRGLLITTAGGGQSTALHVDENLRRVTTLTSEPADPAYNPYWRVVDSADAALFEIGPGNELRFKSAPNYESPADSGHDNTYDVVVALFDGHTGVRTQQISVTVADVSEPQLTPVPVGGKIAISTDAGVFPTHASIAALAGGGFVVTWYAPDGSEPGIYGQRFYASGAADHGAFRIDTGNQGGRYPSVAALPDGGYVVTWTSSDDHSVRGLHYGPTGIPDSSEFVVTHYSDSALADQNTFSTVEAIGGGRFVVAWSSGDAGSYRTFAQIYGLESGTPLLGIVRVDDPAASIGYESIAGVAAKPDGGFTVIWTADAYDGNGSEIYAQAFDAQGAPASTGAVRINQSQANDQLGAGVATLSDGRLVVVWSSDHAVANDFDVYARIYHADGRHARARRRISRQHRDRRPSRRGQRRGSARWRVRRCLGFGGFGREFARSDRATIFGLWRACG